MLSSKYLFRRGLSLSLQARPVNTTFLFLFSLSFSGLCRGGLGSFTYFISIREVFKRFFKMKCSSLFTLISKCFYPSTIAEAGLKGSATAVLFTVATILAARWMRSKWLHVVVKDLTRCKNPVGHTVHCQ